MKKTINLAIDASSIHSEGGLLHLIGILSANGLPNKYVSKIYVWGFSETLTRLPKSNYIFYFKISKIFRNIFLRIFWQLFLFPKNNFLLKCNALYVPSGICLFNPLPKILFFQNLIPFQWVHLRKYRFSKTFFRLILIRVFQLVSSHFASSIIFPSKFSLKIISNSFFFNSKIPIYTIHHGVDQKFFSTPSPQKNIKYFSKKNKNKSLFDLRKYVHDKLLEFKVNIDHVKHDTFIEKDNFFSFRRSSLKKQKDYGRCISVIKLT